MGLLRAVHSGRTVSLVRSVKVGRDPDSGLILSAPGVSRLHLCVSWVGSGWVVRDLASTNGTWLNGELIQTDADVPIRARDRIGAGRSEEALLVLDSDEPPGWVARHRVTGEERFEDEEGQIELPEGTLWRDLERGWVVQEGEGARPIADGQLGPWVLIEPVHLPATLPEFRSALEASLWFRLAGEAIGLTLRWGMVEVDLGWAQPFWPLLLLARARAEDEGWVDMEQLCKKSALKRRTLDVYLLRAKERLERAGVLDAEHLVEVRPSQRRLGLPFERVHEVRAG